MDKKVRWRVIPEFPNYSVSENGDVWSHKRKMMMSWSVKIASSTSSYTSPVVEIYRKKRKVSRLVAYAFVKNERDNEQFNIVDHIDRDPWNNHYTNLRWVSNRENQRNRKGQVLDETTVGRIRCIRLVTNFGSTKISRILGIKETAVSSILYNNGWIDIQPCHPSELPEEIREQIKDYL